GRIIDLSFHHMVRQQIPTIDTPDIQSPDHRPALFLIELAGFPPCQTTDGQLYWSPVTTDPLQGQPDPPCAAKTLPGPLVTAAGQGRVPRVTPQFQVDSASFKGTHGPIHWTKGS